MRLPKCYIFGQVIGSVHKLLATNNVHGNVIIYLTYTNVHGVNGEALQLCAVYVIDTACLG